MPRVNFDLLGKLRSLLPTEKKLPAEQNLESMSPPYTEQKLSQWALRGLAKSSNSTPFAFIASTGVAMCQPRPSPLLGPNSVW